MEVRREGFVCEGGVCVWVAGEWLVCNLFARFNYKYLFL